MDLQQEKNKRQLLNWYNLAFMAFATVWGFGNAVNGYVYFNGVQVIFSWILMFALYFIPYALMVGELGSTFQDAGGGVSSWIEGTMTAKLAYYAGWTYWVVHMPYIASKATGGLKALSWVVFQNSSFYDNMDIRLIQMVTLVVFLFFAWVASRGLNPLKTLATLAGSSMFVMGLLYIVMMIAAPAINPTAHYQTIDWSWNNLIPKFDLQYLTSLSILVFAVGGCEKISPYVNKMKNPAKEFPRGMIFLAVMVVFSAIMGTIALGMMFDVNDVNAHFDSYVANGAYWAFQRLGEYYHLGNTFVVIYALCNLIGQLSVLVISIDAPLRMLLDSEISREFVPHGLLKKNDKGAYVNGIWLIVAIVSPLIILPMFGIGNVTAVLRFLTQLNAVCMPLRYLWVFLAYIALKSQQHRYQSDYQFIKSQGLGKIAGYWCFLVTAACCMLGMFKGSPFEIGLNILTPIVLVGLGVILPKIAEKQKAANTL
ncbi:MAG: amino acid permease [Aerococcus sp.]|nr:amino acid permease [Aerococcus sp.]